MASAGKLTSQVAATPARAAGAAAYIGLMQVADFDPGRILREAAGRVTVEEKLAVAHRLRELAWEVKAGAIRAQHPGLSEAAVQDRVREVFRRALD